MRQVDMPGSPSLEVVTYHPALQGDVESGARAIMGAIGLIRSRTGLVRVGEGGMLTRVTGDRADDCQTFPEGLALARIGDFDLTVNQTNPSRALSAHQLRGGSEHGRVEADGTWHWDAPGAIGAPFTDRVGSVAELGGTNAFQIARMAQEVLDLAYNR